MEDREKQGLRARDITHRMIITNQMHRRMMECNL